MYGDAFPHETNMDRLHGVDFDKGCYVGQEVVSRMQHRGTARTRTVRVIARRRVAGDRRRRSRRRQAGRHHGLDRPAATASRCCASIASPTRSMPGLPLTAGGLAIRLADPDDVRTAPKQTVA